MARPRKNTAKGPKRTASFDGVGKGFTDNQEYLVKVLECTAQTGQSGDPYYKFKLGGTGEFEGSIMYHNASLSAAALWKTRDIFEAFLGDVPEGDFDVDEMADEFVGKVAMCSTFADIYEGTKRIKPEDFWAAEGADNDDEEDSDGGSDSVDLDELSEEDIKAIAEAAGIKVTGKSRASTLRKKLEELEEEELAEAIEEAGISGEDEEEEEGPSADFTADEIMEMSQDELEKLVEENELDVNLDDYKTLRKKRTAVVDAAEEAGLVADD